MKKKYLLKFFMAIVICGIFFLGCSGCKKKKNPPEPTYYYVTFDENNGNETTMVRVEEGKTVTKPENDPVKEDYNFLYWAIDGQEFNFNTPINRHITLVATYEKKSSGDPTKKTTRIIWNENEAIEFLFDGSIPRVVEVGSEVKFKIKVSPFYEGEVKVLVNEKTITKQNDDYYTFIVEDVTSINIDIDGLTKQDERIKGLGTEENPYQIANESQFNVFINRVNSLTDSKYNDAYFVLESNLDFNGYALDVIGSQLNYNHFSGYFDGQNHTISNFAIEQTNGMYGLFGYLVEGIIVNLKIENDLVINVENDAFNIVGGLVAYNIASDVINCHYNGSIIVENNLATSAQVYIGGLVGYMQSYSDTGSSTLSYGTVNAEISFIGTTEVTSAGGLVGAIYGADETYPGIIYNSIYQGDIGGKSLATGGIVGTLRMYTSIANCYTRGSVSARSDTRDTAAGALCGIAENETAITYSFASASVVSARPNATEYLIGDLVGSIAKDGSQGIDYRQVLIVKSFYDQGGKVSQANQTYDLTNYQDVMSLLNWNQNDWNEDLTPNYETGEQVQFVVNFDFGRNVTNEALDGSLLTQMVDQVTINDFYLPIYWIYDGAGMNNFVADDGTISYGFFLDEERTIRVPASYFVTQNMTIYVGFANYQEVVGEYYVILGGKTIKLTFDAMGKMTMSYDGIVANYMYVYDGAKILIRKAYFAYIEYPSLAESYDLDFDYYAEINDHGLIIYNEDLFSKDGLEIIAHRVNNAMGTWYSSDGKVYTFLSDGTGNIDGVTNFTYECQADEVTINLAGQKMIATIKNNGTLMETSDGTILSINKFDEFQGAWEAEFRNPDTITFDGKGEVTYKGQSYQYQIDANNVLTFAEYKAYFNDDGLLILEHNGIEKRFGRLGSYIGTWTDTIIDYWIVFEGINKDGVGYGYDSYGYDFTYANGSEIGEEVFINIFYRTSMYGYGYLSIGKDNYTEMLALAIYTPDRGMMVDDYNVCYIDPLYGTWNGENGMTVTFNGLGAYDIYQYFESLANYWDVRGFVSITQNNIETNNIRYYFNRHTGIGQFEYQNNQYQVQVSEDGLIINSQTFKEPDILSRYQYQYEDTIVSFNGKSTVGLGVVTFINGASKQEYRYEFNDGIANIYNDDTIIYVLDTNKNYELKDVLANKTYNLGLYHRLMNHHFVVSSDTEIIFDQPFDINGVTTATFKLSGDDEQLQVNYIDENYVALYYNGSFLYYVYYLDEDCAVLCNYNFVPLSAIATSDELRGMWIADDGSTISFSGISKASQYAHASCEVSESDEIENYISEYFYELHDNYYVIYDLVNEEEIEKYDVYTTYQENAIAYHQGDKTIYVVAVKD